MMGVGHNDLVVLNFFLPCRVKPLVVTNQSKKIHKERRKHVKDRLMSEKAMSNINRG